MFKNKSKPFNKIITCTFSGIVFCCAVAMSHAVLSAENTLNEGSSINDVSQSKSIANDIEQIKKEVLKLNRELFILEEDLLFPASTQVAVFVSVDIGHFFTLDSVELKLNGNEVAGFLYTQRQRESLEKGGIQQLFKGNVKTGSHELTAIFIGVDNEKRPVKRAVTYQFVKEDDAVMIELKVEDNTRKLQAEVNIEEWDL